MRLEPWKLHAYKANWEAHECSKRVGEIRRTAHDDKEIETEFCLLLFDWDECYSHFGE